MDRLKVIQVLVSVAGISLGQLFLKLAALNLSNPKTIGIWIGNYCINLYLIFGVALLGAATLLWVWILRSLPLNIAYPFMALAFLFVPVLSHYALGEPLGWKSLAGGLLIVAGVALVSS